MILKVIKERCPQNHKCPALKVCPNGALKQNNYEAPIVDENKCILCGECAQTCPMKALVLE